MPIVHCDLKPSNILLDDDMIAYVGDFGLARFLQRNSYESSSIGIKGTICYAPPEYGLGSEMTTNGDVYSFGVLLLEMMTGKRPTDEIFMEGLNLHMFARNALSDNVIAIVDSSLLDSDKEKEEMKPAKKLGSCLSDIIKIGVRCAVESPQDRPNIKNALHELQDIRNTLVNA